jgi:hypothetical protein
MPLSEAQRRILEAIPPGRDVLGAGAGYAELAGLFPGAARTLRELVAAGYVEIVTLSIDETGPEEDDRDRVYCRTDRADAALLRG